jgi:hypothetical protein
VIAALAVPARTIGDRDLALPSIGAAMAPRRGTDRMAGRRAMAPATV